MRACANISAFIDAHGDDAVRRVLENRRKKRGRPIGPAKWDYRALGCLWVMVHVRAHILRRLERTYTDNQISPERQFSYQRRCPLTGERLKLVTLLKKQKNWRSILRRFYEADDLMKEWKREG